MNNQIIQQQVEEILKKILNNDEITISLSTSLIEDLVLDSIMFVELVVEIETNFCIQFEEEYLLMERIDKVEQLVQYISEKI